MTFEVTVTCSSYKHLKSQRQQELLISTGSPIIKLYHFNKIILTSNAIH